MTESEIRVFKTIAEAARHIFPDKDILQPKHKPSQKALNGNQFSLATIGKVFARFVGKHDVLPEQQVDGEYDFLDPIKIQVREISEVFEANREEILDNADEPQLAASTRKSSTMPMSLSLRPVL